MSTTDKPDTTTPPPAAAALSTKELAFLATIRTGHWNLKNNAASPAIQSLIDRGYCRTEKERLGPLGIYTGEVTIMLTESALTSLFPKATPAATPAPSPLNMNATIQTDAAAAAESKPSGSLPEFICPLREQVSFAFQGYIKPLPRPRSPRVGETVIAEAFLESNRALGVVIVAGVILEEVTRSGQASEYAVRDHINGKVYFTRRTEMRRIAPFVPSASIPMFMPLPGGGSRLKTRSEKMLWLIDDLRAAGVTPSRYR